MRFEGQLVRTPILRSHTLSQITGADLWLKFENLQFTGSFKERGALNKLCRLNEEEKQRGVICMSAGNHAQGVAYNAKKLSIPATIVMPITTPYVKVKYTQEHGADVVLHGQTLSEADAEARRLAEVKELVFVHPYDDLDVIIGQGTVALEMLEDVPCLDILIVPLGGGGLISGCALAAKSINPNIRIYGIETELYPYMYNILHGSSVKGGGATIAEGIAVKHVGKLTKDICEVLVEDVLLVKERSIEHAINLLLNIEKTLVEGAGAAALAALIDHPDRFMGKKCGAILSGGNIDPTTLATVVNRGLVLEGRLAKLRLQLVDAPGELATVTRHVAELGGNVVEVQHQRLFGDLSVKSASLDIMLEARDHRHVEEIVNALGEFGYPTRLCSLLSDDI